MEIYPGENYFIPSEAELILLSCTSGSKLRHFKSIHKKTGIAYSEMLFFDDEARNKEVESLG